MDGRSRRIVLRRYPLGLPRAADFEMSDAPITEPGDGEVLVETHYLSMDPAPRMRMDGASKAPPPMPLGQVVGGRGVGLVLESRFAALRPGDAVAGELGWQEFATLSGAQLRKVNTALGPAQAALGLLGPSGITAWFLTREAAKITPEDTVVIAAAAGSVGSTAVQLARLAGARVVALIGGERQARFAREELGVAAAVDYRSGRLDEELGLACPTGFTVFLDSVGGSLHNAVMAHAADHARVVVFGYISAYNDPASSLPEYGRIYQVIRRRVELHGFLIGDHAARFGEALDDLSRLLKAGRISNFEDCAQGLERAPASFAALFSGEPVGKQLVRVTHVTPPDRPDPRQVQGE